jgi:hypothetical protein
LSRDNQPWLLTGFLQGRNVEGLVNSVNHVYHQRRISGRDIEAMRILTH